MRPATAAAFLSRRAWLARTGTGFGLVGLTGALAQTQWLAADASATRHAPGNGPHFAPRAKRVIFLFMNGGPSHVDTFDPKPALARHAGEKPAGKLHKSPSGGFHPSPFQFAPRGQSGVVLSELLPRLGQVADELCVLRGMYTDVPNHEPGLLLMHSGHQQPVRPSLGSWAVYGLGSENENLPAYVTLCPGRPVVGPQLWSNSFLPGEFQATAINTQDMDVERLVANLKHPHLEKPRQRRQLDLVLQLNRLHQESRRADPRLESHIRAMELAFQMQASAAEAFDISREPESIRAEYGDSLFGRSCLLARRLAERDVRFVQVYYVTPKSKQPWDTHANNDDGHRKLCADSDQASAALILDLKRRGLLDETLVVWGGEFGRTPYAQVDKKNPRKPGRDHHHTGFSMFLAGGGVRGGMMHGATDPFGMDAIEGRVHVHDLHATLLHLLGFDHERLTYHHSGRDFRLTDVHGRVVQEILA